MPVQPGSRGKAFEIFRGGLHPALLEVPDQGAVDSKLPGEGFLAFSREAHQHTCKQGFSSHGSPFLGIWRFFTIGAATHTSRIEGAAPGDHQRPSAGAAWRLVSCAQPLPL